MELRAAFSPLCTPDSAPDAVLLRNERLFQLVINVENNVVCTNHISFRNLHSLPASSPALSHLDNALRSFCVARTTIFGRSPRCVQHFRRRSAISIRDSLQFKNMRSRGVRRERAAPFWRPSSRRNQMRSGFASRPSIGDLIDQAVFSPEWSVATGASSFRHFFAQVSRQRLVTIR